MTFEEGKPTGDFCPKCGKKLIYYMGFEDRANSKNEHCTVDMPMIVCEDKNCDYQIDCDEEVM